MGSAERLHGRAGLPYKADPIKADPIKAELAAIFRAKWEEAKADSIYLRLMQRHRALYEAE